MHQKLQILKEQIHALIDIIFTLNMESQLPELIAKHIALQNIVNSFQLSEEEISQYFLDKEVEEYIEKYQRYCLNFEIYLENLMTTALIHPQRSSEIIRLLRSYYSSIYEIMSKNEITLANINKNSKVCMVGVGSMPLSMLFIHRFSGANIVGIDKSKETIVSTRQCIAFISEYSPERYHSNAFSIIGADGEEFNYTGFDVIVLSIHIENKDAVIKRILDTTADKNRLILLDRKVAGLCQYFYKNNPINIKNASLLMADSLISGLITTQALAYKSIVQLVKVF